MTRTETASDHELIPMIKQMEESGWEVRSITPTSWTTEKGDYNTNIHSATYYVVVFENE